MKLLVATLFVMELYVTLALPSYNENEGAAMDDILEVNGDNQYLYGDEILTEEQKEEFSPDKTSSGRSERKRRGLTRNAIRARWPNKEMHYTISNDYTNAQKDTIRAAIRSIASRSCVRFIEHDLGSAPRDHVAIRSGTGCSSFIGRIGGSQQLSLRTDGCVFTGTIIHEVLHALGFFHEQSRADRDQFVTINTVNIETGRETNFDRAATNSLGVEYDPQSVMHYSNRAFSNGNGPTIVWKQNPSLRLGGRVLTDKDVEQLNLFYECSNPITTSTTTRSRPTTTTTTRRPTTTTRRSTSSTTRSTTSTTRATASTTRSTRACGDIARGCFLLEGRESIYCGLYGLSCPRTCSLCTGPASERCLNLRDSYSSTYCAGLTQFGSCRSSRSVKSACARTCCDRGEYFQN